MNTSSLAKQRYILDYAFASLLRRKSKNIALGLVYSFLVFLISTVLFTATSLKHEASLTLEDAPEITVQRLVAGRQDLIPVAYADSISAIRGIQSVQPRLWGYYFDSLSGATYTVQASTDLAENSGETVIGAGVSRRYEPEKPARKISENDILPFKTHDGHVKNLVVKGFFPAHSELITADLILISETDFRTIFGIQPGYATDLVIKARNERELATIAAKIVQLHPDTRPILRNEIMRTYEAVFDWRSGLILLVLSGTLCAFAVLAWDKATGLSAEERKEIGILKAVGWDTSDVLYMKFWEGAAISMLSFFVGVIGAYFHTFIASLVLFEPILKGWTVLYPEFRLTPSVTVYQLTTLFILTVIPYTVTTIIPSWRAATIDPDSVMRS